MEFIKYNTKQEFLDNNLKMLLKEEAKNEVMIGITLEHSSEKVNKWLLGRIEDEGKIKAIFLVDDDRKGLLLYAIDELLSDEVCEFLVDNIIRLNINLTEVLTSKENAIKISKLYSNKKNLEMLETEYMDILRFDIFKEEHILNPGEFIEKVEMNNVDFEALEIIEREMFRDTYYIENCSDEKVMSTINAFIRKGLYVLKNEKGEIVSQAVTVRKQINGCAIGGVITPSAHRGHGYAKRCVYALCKILLKQGYKFVVLHVDPENIAAINVYKKIGFEQIDVTEKIKFKSK